MFIFRALSIIIHLEELLSIKPQSCLFIVIFSYNK